MEIYSHVLLCGNTWLAASSNIQSDPEKFAEIQILKKLTHVLCIKVLFVAAVHVLQQWIHHVMFPIVTNASHLHVTQHKSRSRFSEL